MGILKRIRELEEENDFLKKKIRYQENYLGGILEKANFYLKRNCSESLAGMRTIKQLAEFGLDKGDK